MVLPAPHVIRGGPLKTRGFAVVEPTKFDWSIMKHLQLRWNKCIRMKLCFIPMTLEQKSGRNEPYV
jgi:hypothetical protein